MSRLGHGTPPPAQGRPTPLTPMDGHVTRGALSEYRMEAADVTRAAIYLAFVLAAMPTWAQVDNDGQEDAAQKAAQAAKAALNAEKKTPAEMAPAEKAPAEKAPAKKAPDKEGPTKKAPAKKPTGAVPAWAGSPGAGTPTPGHELQANWDAANSAEIRVGFPWVEHHGAFRVRADVLHNLDFAAGKASA